MKTRKIPFLFCCLFIFVNILAPTTPQSDTSEGYFFFVHMIAPTLNPVRMQFAQLMESELPNIGIDTELDLLSWAAFGPRCTDQEVGMYREGGYDIAFFGMSALPKGIEGVFGANSFPPSGFNVGYWSPVTEKGYYNYRAQESENLLTQIKNSYNRSEAREKTWDWQKLWYDALPNIVIYNQQNVFPISKHLYGFDPSQYPLNSYLWFDNEEKNLNFCTTNSPKTFNSIRATDLSSLYVTGLLMEGLVENLPSESIVLPTNYNKTQWMIDNFEVADYNDLYPSLAISLGNYSPDQQNYNISVRDDVYWHDGVKFDAWDVAFSFQAHLSPIIGASEYSILLVPFGLDNKAERSGNYSFTVEDKNSDSFYESISFQLANSFPPFEEDLLGIDLFPEHILGDPVSHGFDVVGDFDTDEWLIQPSDWSTHSTSTGRTTDEGGYTGPIGTGPMIFKESSPSTGRITLEKFHNIIWDGSAWIGDSSVNYHNPERISTLPDTINIRTISDPQVALNSLINGEIHLLDPQYNLNDFIKEIRAEDTIKHILIPHSGWQGLFMNPKFNQDGIYHFQRKGVRHAISHMIPRTDIISYLLDGLAKPAYTPLPPISRSVIPEQEMINFKNTLLATDATTPESESNTSYDKYDITLALDWMDTEGYDTGTWHGPQPTNNSSSGITFFMTVLVILVLTYFSTSKKSLKKV